MGVPRSLTRRVRTLKPLGLCRAFVSITTGRSGRLLIFVRRAAHSHRLVPDSARPLQQDRAKGKRFVNSERPRQFERPTRVLSWWPIPGRISRWKLGLARVLAGLLAELALGLHLQWGHGRAQRHHGGPGVQTCLWAPDRPQAQGPAHGTKKIMAPGSRVGSGFWCSPGP
jgi:hypothetical protein